MARGTRKQLAAALAAACSVAVAVGGIVLPLTAGAAPADAAAHAPALLDYADSRTSEEATLPT